ncbi:hypothetical protein ILUMI_18658, partial [Ignelater luminosus]
MRTTDERLNMYQLLSSADTINKAAHICSDEILKNAEGVNSDAKIVDFRKHENAKTLNIKVSDAGKLASLQNRGSS